MVSNRITHEVTYNCHLCEKAFSKKYELRHHLTTHNRRKSFKCDHPGCSKKFIRKDNLNMHLLVKHKRIRNEFGCPHCGNIAYSSYTLKLHMKHIHAKNVGLPFPCNHPGCSKRFGRKDLLDQHLRNHNPNNAFGCLLCIERFSSIRSFKYHMSIVHLHNEKGSDKSYASCDRQKIKSLFRISRPSLTFKSFKKYFALRRSNLKGSEKLYSYDCPDCHFVVDDHPFIGIVYSITGHFINCTSHKVHDELINLFQKEREVFTANFGSDFDSTSKLPYNVLLKFLPINSKYGCELSILDKNDAASSRAIIHRGPSILIPTKYIRNKNRNY